MGAKIRGKDKRIIKATMTTPMHYRCRIRKMYINGIQSVLTFSSKFFLPLLNRPRAGKNIKTFASVPKNATCLERVLTLIIM